MNRDRHIIDYEVDEENNLWCDITMQFPLSGSKVMIVSLIEKAAEKAIVHQCPGIKRGLLAESKGVPGEAGRYRLKTDGVNVSEMRKHPEVLELNSLYSNNIHEMAKSYGIEAARRVLVKEIKNVFGVYGIRIDNRHLALIADYMTFEGEYKPFNRIAIKSNSSPFQKMSYETCISFLKGAACNGEPEMLTSASSRLVVGRPIEIGTNAMIDILPKLS